MIDMKDLQKNDPLKRMVERQSEREEFSPMDPPDAYSPPAGEEIPVEQMPMALRKLMDDHSVCAEELKKFEDVLSRIQEEGLTKEIASDGGIGHFFRFFDERIVLHNVKEEKVLFPVLSRRLLEEGEHSQGAQPRSAVDMLEDDHGKLLQLAAVAFSFFGLAVRLPDSASRAITLDAALEQSKALVEGLRLHVFREDHVVFPMAARLLTDIELTAMAEELAGFHEK